MSFLFKCFKALLLSFTDIDLYRQSSKPREKNSIDMVFAEPIYSPIIQQSPKTKPFNALRTLKFYVFREILIKLFLNLNLCKLSNQCTQIILLYISQMTSIKFLLLLSKNRFVCLQRKRVNTSFHGLQSKLYEVCF